MIFIAQRQAHTKQCLRDVFFAGGGSGSTVCTCQSSSNQPLNHSAFYLLNIPNKKHIHTCSVLKLEFFSNKNHTMFFYQMIHEVLLPVTFEATILTDTLPCLSRHATPHIWMLQLNVSLKCELSTEQFSTCHTFVFFHFFTCCMISLHGSIVILNCCRWVMRHDFDVQQNNYQKYEQK